MTTSSLIEKAISEFESAAGLYQRSFGSSYSVMDSYKAKRDAAYQALLEVIRQHTAAPDVVARVAKAINKVANGSCFDEPGVTNPEECAKAAIAAMGDVSAAHHGANRDSSGTGFLEASPANLASSEISVADDPPPISNDYVADGCEEFPHTKSKCQLAFEKWSNNKFSLGSITGKGYTSKRTSYCWYSWQACWKLLSTPKPVSSKEALEQEYNRGVDAGFEAGMKSALAGNHLKGAAKEQPDEYPVWWAYEKASGNRDLSALIFRKGNSIVAVMHGEVADYLYPVLNRELLSRDTKRESGWVKFPENCPAQYSDYVPVSDPLLFLTESEASSHLRLGYYDHEDGCFYESCDDLKLRHVGTVTKFLTFEYPKLKGTKIEGGAGE